MVDNNIFPCFQACWEKVEPVSVALSHSGSLLKNLLYCCVFGSNFPRKIVFYDKNWRVKVLEFLAIILRYTYQYYNILEDQALKKYTQKNKITIARHLGTTNPEIFLVPIFLEKKITLTIEQEAK